MQLFCKVSHINYIVEMKQRTIGLLPNFFDLGQLPHYPSSHQMRSNANPIELKRQSAIQQVETKWSKKLFNKNTHSKTQTIERQRPSKYELPEINYLKNPLIEMKSNEVQRSSKLILNSNKNTKMLNQIIQILREDSITMHMKKKKQPSRTNFKRAIHTDISDNEFLENNDIKPKQAPVFQRGPKIVNPQFMKICDKKIMSRRKIFSEERSRQRPKIKKSLNLNINQSPEQNPNLLTFYKPLKKTIEPTGIKNFKDIDQNFRVQI